MFGGIGTQYVPDMHQACCITIQRAHLWALTPAYHPSPSDNVPERVFRSKWPVLHLLPIHPTLNLESCEGGKHQKRGINGHAVWVETIQNLVLSPCHFWGQPWALKWPALHFVSVAALHRVHPAPHVSYRSTSAREEHVFECAFLTLKRTTFEVSPIPLECLKISEVFSRTRIVTTSSLDWFEGNDLQETPVLHCFTPCKKDEKGPRRMRKMGFFQP